MTTTFVLALIPITFAVTVLWAPSLIETLRTLRFGKQIRLEGPASHHSKAGTPTMGGTLFILTTLAACAVLVPDRAAIAPPLLAMLVFGVAGALDDYANMRSKQGLGFRVRYKFIWHGLISLALAFWLYQDANLRVQNLPGGASIDLGWTFVPLVAFAIFSCAAGVNEVDGLDGLAGGTTLIAFATYLALALGASLLPAAAVCASLIGALLGFLWFNSHPARVFMGDTGSLALGAGLAVIAFQTGWGLLLPIIGFVFVLDLVSVILQVGYFRLTGGKRLFPMTPIHHGFEVIGWPETLVTQRFWILGILASAIGLALSV
jgi:phospho-N-acetylmuramoyl-pentapeptide-transferase